MTQMAKIFLGVESDNDSCLYAVILSLSRFLLLCSRFSAVFQVICNISSSAFFFSGSVALYFDFVATTPHWNKQPKLKNHHTKKLKIVHIIIVVVVVGPFGRKNCYESSRIRNYWNKITKTLAFLWQTLSTSGREKERAKDH